MAMLDRRNIKKDVKGMLGGECKGSVFLATLLVFIIVLIYFGAVWGIAQFYPVTQADLKSLGDMANATYSQAQPASDMQGYSAFFSQLATSAGGVSTALNNVGMINCWASLLELIIMLPLMIGGQKFMLRVIRLKNPSAGTVLKGYTGAYFFRSILLPFWRAICLAGWYLIMLVLLCGMLAGAALATGLNAQNFMAIFGGATSASDAIAASFTAEYLTNYGWVYILVMCGWYALTAWLMVFKHISYSLSGMALAERPQIGVRKALRASRRIARHNHFALFVVSLSFIGWYLLVDVALALVVAVGIGMNLLNMGQLGLIITLGIGAIVVLLCMYLLMPYRVGVHAQCYVRLKRAALEDGVVIKDDFRGKHELNAVEEQA